LEVGRDYQYIYEDIMGDDLRGAASINGKLNSRRRRTDQKVEFFCTVLDVPKMVYVSKDN